MGLTVALMSAVAAAVLMPGGAARAATPPGVLVVAQSIDDAVSFDPAEGFELTTVQTFNNVYQRLVQSNRDDGTRIEPALAASWQPAADGKSLTFTLAPGARFASGHPVRPEDVIFSLTRAVKLNKAPAFILNELGWSADNVDQAVTRVDDNHVKIAWSADVGPAFALAILTAPIASIVDEAAVTPQASGGDFGNAWLKSHSAGSGAFTITTYAPHEALVLDANASAPGGAPKLHSVILRNVPDSAARRLLIEQGDADIARGLGSDQIAALKGEAGVKVLAVPSARTDYLLINTKANATLGNPAFWEAARYLIDYQGIATNLLGGQAQVHQAFLPVGFPGALKDTPFKLDIAKARKILADAKIGPTTIAFPVFNEAPFLQIAQSLQATFAQAGLTLDIQPGVASDIYAKGRSGNYAITLRYWIPDYFDPHSNASAFAINRDNSHNTVARQAGWVIPELSDETAAAVKEQDPAKRTALYEALQHKIQARSPYVFMLQGSEQVVLRDGLKGYAQGLNSDQVYYDQVEK